MQQCSECRECSQKPILPVAREYFQSWYLPTLDTLGTPDSALEPPRASRGLIPGTSLHWPAPFHPDSVVSSGLTPAPTPRYSVDSSEHLPTVATWRKLETSPDVNRLQSSAMSTQSLRFVGDRACFAAVCRIVAHLRGGANG